MPRQQIGSSRDGDALALSGRMQMQMSTVTSWLQFAFSLLFCRLLGNHLGYAWTLRDGIASFSLWKRSSNGKLGLELQPPHRQQGPAIVRDYWQVWAVKVWASEGLQVEVMLGPLTGCVVLGSFSVSLNRMPSTIKESSSYPQSWILLNREWECFCEAHSPHSKDKALGALP